jgi:protocatechuate 3,4-dioxygenase beta subunit
MDEHRINRRGALAKLGGFAAVAFGGTMWKSDAEGAGPEAVAAGLVTCVLTPEQTEGPFYVAGEKVRRNITEGRPGTPLTLRLRVVNASNCKGIKNAAVDIWHTDALGVYSGVQGSSGTFMRGIQRTDANGLAVFKTVYPGWYNGRTVHIHVKVHLGGNVVHTGQLYFPDSVTDRVYANAPYSSRAGRDTRNAADSIYRNGGSKSVLGLRRSGAGYVASLTMGVHRS